MIFTTIGAVVIGVLLAAASRIQSTTLWAGRAIAPRGSEALMPTGVQDAITPRWQTRLNLAWIVGLVVLLVAGSFQRWYFGAVAVIAALVASAAVQTILPRRLATYLRLIASDLANREANYRRAGDSLRADAAHEFFLKLALLLERAVSADQLVPTMREARTTPLGQADD